MGTAMGILGAALVESTVADERMARVAFGHDRRLGAARGTPTALEPITSQVFPASPVPIWFPNQNCTCKPPEELLRRNQRRRGTLRLVPPYLLGNWQLVVRGSHGGHRALALAGRDDDEGDDDGRSHYFVTNWVELGCGCLSRDPTRDTLLFPHPHNQNSHKARAHHTRSYYRYYTLRPHSLTHIDLLFPLSSYYFSTLSLLPLYTSSLSLSPSHKQKLFSDLFIPYIDFGSVFGTPVLIGVIPVSYFSGLATSTPKPLFSRQFVNSELILSLSCMV